MSKKYPLLAAVMIVIATSVAIVSVWNDSPVVDEVPHIGSGYDYVVEHSYKFNPEHPPLAKDVAGFGLLTQNLNQSVFTRSHQGNWPTDVHGEWNFGRDLIFESGNNAQTVAHAAKIPMLLFFILLAVIIFIWTRKLYGEKAALLATFLFSFSPTMIAHSRLVTTDIAALFGITLATFFFTRYLENQTKKNFWLAGLTFGVALLCKFSTFLLVPYFVVIAIIWSFAHRHAFHSLVKIIWRTILVMAVGLVIVVGPIYQLHLQNYSGAEQKADAITILQTYGNRHFADPIIWASDKPILRPFAYYGLGLLMINQRNAGGNQTFFFGTVATKAYKSYFPVVYLLKEPIPFLILFLIAIIGFFFFQKSKEKKFKDWLAAHFVEIALLVWVAFYWGISITANLNIGIRHVIPVYAFTIILVSGQVAMLYHRVKNKKAYLIFVGALLAWFLAETIMIFPYYLTYFNEFASIRPSWAAGQAGWVSGGQNYVVDSNLDWGQDLKRLADWTNQNNIPKMTLDYFGWSDPNYYLGAKANWVGGGRYKSAKEFLADNPSGGYFAVSATFYEQSIVSDHNYAWLENIKPVAFIGHSIFVWHILP